MEPTTCQRRSSMRTLAGMRLAGVFVSALAGFACGTATPQSGDDGTDSSVQECPIGTVGCPCSTGSGACVPGLSCEQGTCVDLGGGDGAGSTSTGASASTTGEVTATSSSSGAPADGTGSTSDPPPGTTTTGADASTTDASTTDASTGSTGSSGSSSGESGGSSSTG